MSTMSDSLFERENRKMYSVDVCGVCVHERKVSCEEPCNDCLQLRSNSKQSHFQNVDCGFTEEPKVGLEELVLLFRKCDERD